MDVVGRVGNSRNEFPAMDRHDVAPGYPAAAGLPTYLPSTRIYLRAVTPISAPAKNWQFACKFRAMFRPLSTPAASSYPSRAFFQPNVPPETTEFTSTFHRIVRQHAFRLPFLSPIRNLSDHEQRLTTLSRCIPRVGTSSD